MGRWEHRGRVGRRPAGPPRTGQGNRLACRTAPVRQGTAAGLLGNVLSSPVARRVNIAFFDGLSNVDAWKSEKVTLPGQDEPVSHRAPLAGAVRRRPQAKALCGRTSEALEDISLPLIHFSPSRPDLFRFSELRNGVGAGVETAALPHGRTPADDSVLDLVETDLAAEIDWIARPVPGDRLRVRLEHPARLFARRHPLIFVSPAAAELSGPNDQTRDPRTWLRESVCPPS